MAGAGTYSEKLPCGGTLEVTKDGFRIRYYFLGPDARHNGTFVDLQGSRLRDYISAYQENWEKLLALKATIPAGGEFSQAGTMGMQIRLGKFNAGVCIRAYHMPLNTKTSLERVIASFEYAIKRAEKAQAMLREI
jgi:hypothetical protein